MSKNTKKIPMWAQTGHAQPVTRREFLSAGLLPFAASLALPNWASLLLGSQARAETPMNCPVPASLIPFVTLNLSGGAALGSNFVPMNLKREPIASYSKMGLGDNQVPLEMEFGNVPFAGMNNGVLISKFLVGVRTQATAATLANTAFVGIPCDSQNDTGANKFDISGAISKAGLIGTNFPNLGRANSRTGINQASAIIAPPAPLVVNDYSALLNSIGYSSALGKALNPEQKNSLAKLMSNLNSTQTRKLASLQGANGVKKVLDCAGIKNIDVVAQGDAAVDPRKNADFAKVWGVTTNTANNNRELVFGAMVYNSLSGQAGTSSLEIGGFDYHNNTRTTGDTKDQDAGVTVGRILQSAAVLNKPVFIYVTSDGSVSSQDSQNRNAAWTGDRGSNGVAYMLYYDPQGRPATSDYQIGQFNDNQAADTSFITGGNPEMVAAAVFANWCQANKRNDLFETIAGRVFETEQISQVIKLA